MKKLKYRVIKSKAQCKEYCSVLETLLESSSKSRDEIELLTLLIEKWDEEHDSFDDLDPVQFLSALMEQHAMKAKDLLPVLDVSKGLVSDILNYKKGISKVAIKKLADHFKVAQEAFNRPYPLKLAVPYHGVRHKMIAAEPKGRYGRSKK